MRIGFVAIRGLRVWDAELLKLGLQFPALANRARDIAALPSLGLLTLAGMTSSEVATQRWIEIDDVENDELNSDCDVVAITALAATETEVLRLAERFSELGTLVIVGGLGVSLNPNAFIDRVDSIVIGEGEPVWPALLEDLQNNQLKSEYRSIEYPAYNLIDSPMPAFELLDKPELRRFSVQTERGCPWACDFCAASMRLSSFKTKPVENVIRELQRIKDISGYSFVEFADDNTFADKAHSRRLMRSIGKTGFTFFAETDLSIADDEELLRMMRDAGCRQVLIGFESPDFDSLDGVEQRSNWKARRHSRALSAVEKIQSHGIAVVGCFVLGLDGAGPKSFDAVREFVESSGLYDVQLTYMTPFPGTPLYQRLNQQGRMLVDSVPGKYTLFDITFKPSDIGLKDLEDGYRNLMMSLYPEEMVERRRKKFFSHLRKRVELKRSEK